MSVIGLLEGQRLRYRLSGRDAHVPYNESWAREFAANPELARAHYLATNQETLDPEFWPTLDSFLAANGTSAPVFTPDPGVLNPADVAAQTEVARVAEEAAQRALAYASAHSDAGPSAADLAYQANARALQEESDRAWALAHTSRDSVTGPAFQPDPATMQDCTGRAGEITCANPANDAQGGRAGTMAATTATPETKSLFIPLAIAAAAFFMVKG